MSPAAGGAVLRPEMQRRAPPAVDRLLTLWLPRLPPPAPRYEDGDREHLTLEELRRHLVDPEGCQQRLEEAAAAEAGAGPHHGGGENENDENEAAAGGAAPSKRQRTGGVLRDATDRSRNAAPAPGEERRSRWVLCGMQQLAGGCMCGRLAAIAFIENLG